MNTITIAGHDIIIFNDRPAGIIVSGGADSSLMLYVLMEHIADHLHIYTIFEPGRREAAEPAIDDSIELCSQLTGKTNFTVHKYDVADQNPETLFRTVSDKLNSGEVDIMYAGLTKFPPYEMWKDHPEVQPQWHIDARTDEVQKPLFGVNIPVREDTDFSLLTSGGLPQPEVKSDDRLYVPWVNLNKKDIADMYKELDLEKNLFPVTRSCENPGHPVTHCNKCFWCAERKWAFGYLDHPDEQLV
jgi:hypothetical protein